MLPVTLSLTGSRVPACGILGLTEGSAAEDARLQVRQTNKPHKNAGPANLSSRSGRSAITNDMEKILTGSIEMSWDPDVRLAIIRFGRDTLATGKDAVAMVDAITGWIGTDGKPFGLLGDGGRLSGLDAEYRSVWGAFLRQHRQDAYLAFFNMNAIVRIAADMFGIGARLRLRAFADESGARAWLRDNGIRA